MPGLIDYILGRTGDEPKRAPRGLIEMLTGGPTPMEPDLLAAQAGGIDPTTLPQGWSIVDGGTILDGTGNPAPITRRPGVLPLTRDAQTGQVQFAMPRALEALGLAMPGLRPARATVAPARGKLYDPPTTEPRPFERDYPGGAAPDATGQPLTHDIDGRPLGARYVAGRRAHGGADHGLSTGELEEVGRETAASRIGVRRREDLSPRGDVDGRVEFAVDKDGRIVVGLDRADDLPADQIRGVTAHEVGHPLEMRAGGWPADEAAVRARKFGMPIEEGSRVEEQIFALYNDLNNPVLNEARAAGRAVAPDSRFANYGPRDAGYLKTHEREELWAEAFRAYLTDPNYIKTVAPDVADAIRAGVNGNPRLNKIVQFNSTAPPGLIGMLTAEGDGHRTGGSF